MNDVANFVIVMTRAMRERYVFLRVRPPVRVPVTVDGIAMIDVSELVLLDNRSVQATLEY